MTQTQTHVSVFPAAEVTRLLAVADQHGADIDLAKDEGAYLMTRLSDGSPATEVIVYAQGHRPPPRTGPGSFTADDPWVVARAHTEQVWGGDDFALTFDREEIRAALTEEGVRVRTTLSVHELPADYPTGLWGRRDPICHCERIDLLPAHG